MDRYTEHTDTDRPDTPESEYYMETNEHLLPLTFRQLIYLDLLDDPDSLFAMGRGGNFFFC